MEKSVSNFILHQSHFELDLCYVGNGSLHHVIIRRPNDSSVYLAENLYDAANIIVELEKDLPF